MSQRVNDLRPIRGLQSIGAFAEAVIPGRTALLIAECLDNSKLDVIDLAEVGIPSVPFDPRLLVHTPQRRGDVVNAQDTRRDGHDEFIHVVVGGRAHAGVVEL